MRLIWTASSYDVACILFIPNNSDDFQSQCGRNEIGQVECYQSILIIAMQRQVYWIYVQLCNHGGVKESLCTPRTIMVKFAILALAVGKRTGPLVGVRYIYLRKNVEIWWGVKRCIFDICTEGFNIKPEILDCSLF